MAADVVAQHRRATHAAATEDHLHLFGQRLRERNRNIDLLDRQRLLSLVGKLDEKTLETIRLVGEFLFRGDGMVSLHIDFDSRP